MKEKQKFPVLWLSSIILIFYAGAFGSNVILDRSGSNWGIGVLFWFSMFVIGTAMNIHSLNNMKESKK